MNIKNILKLSRMIAKFTEVKTEKAILTVNGELEVGAEVFVEVDGEMVEAEDGEYVAEDERIIVIEGGKVVEIKEKEEEIKEDESDEELSAKDKFNKVKSDFEATYQDVEKNLYNAFEALGLWAYIVENTDEYAIVSVWNEEDFSEHYFKYAITVAEDGSVTIGDGKEVKIAYVPADEETTIEETMSAEEETEDTVETDEKDAKIAELEALVAEKDAKIAELQAIIDEANKPVEEPVQMNKTPKAFKDVNNRALRYFE